MGLDMYAYTTKEKPDSLAGFHPKQARQIFYWRKHPNLHGWMENLYRKNGGEAKFNCQTVFLTADDLDQLEADVRGKKLPHTEGFFFGDSSIHSPDEDLDFIKKARVELAEGNHVFYYSWW